MAVVAVAAVVGVASYACSSLFGKKENKSKSKPPQPDTLANLKIASVSEGTPIPIVYGTARVPANFLAVGGFILIPRVTTSSGGKGGGGTSSTISGFFYLVSCWMAVAQVGNKWSGQSSEEGRLFAHTPAKIEWDSLWLDGTKRNTTTMYYYFTSNMYLVNLYGAVATFLNSGVNNEVHEWSGNSPLDYKIPVEGIANLYVINYVSEDGWRLPSYEFAARCLPTMPTSTDLNIFFDLTSTVQTIDSKQTYGCNPAYAVYDALRRAGVPNANIDSASFVEAAEWFYNLEGTEVNGRPPIMINMAVTSQTKVGDVISAILEHLEYILVVDSGTFSLRSTMMTSSNLSGTIVDDFMSFTLKSKDIHDIPSEFRAKYTDITEYEDEMVCIYHEWIRALKGGAPGPATIDLSKITQKTTAQWILAYYAQKAVCSNWSVQAICSYRALCVRPGQLWKFVSTTEGVSGIFQITKVTINPISEGTVEIEGEATALVMTDAKLQMGSVIALSGNGSMPIAALAQEGNAWVHYYDLNTQTSRLVYLSYTDTSLSYVQSTDVSQCAVDSIALVNNNINGAAVAYTANGVLTVTESNPWLLNTLVVYLKKNIGSSYTLPTICQLDYSSGYTYWLVLMRDLSGAVYGNVCQTMAPMALSGTTTAIDTNSTSIDAIAAYSCGSNNVIFAYQFDKTHGKVGFLVTSEHTISIQDIQNITTDEVTDFSIVDTTDVNALVIFRNVTQGNILQGIILSISGTTFTHTDVFDVIDSTTITYEPKVVPCGTSNALIVYRGEDNYVYGFIMKLDGFSFSIGTVTKINGPCFNISLASLDTSSSLFVWTVNPEGGTLFATIISSGNDAQLGGMSIQLDDQTSDYLTEMASE
jgi:hypothetical protein